MLRSHFAKSLCLCWCYFFFRVYLIILRYEFLKYFLQEQVHLAPMLNILFLISFMFTNKTTFSSRSNIMLSITFTNSLCVSRSFFFFFCLYIDIYKVTYILLSILFLFFFFYDHFYFSFKAFSIFFFIIILTNKYLSWLKKSNRKWHICLQWNHTLDLVHRPSIARIVVCHWVLTVEHNFYSTIDKVKACLVAKEALNVVRIFIIWPK